MFKRGDYFYLTVTYSNGEGGYHQTWMFRSKDPLNFGNYGGAGDQTSKENCDFVTGFGAHAPEVIYEPDADKWYITTSGWSWSWVKKPLAASNGVAIAEIEWKKKGTFLTNHDFEYGTLTGWQRSGDAFALSLANFHYEGRSLEQNGSFFISSLFFEDSNAETYKVDGKAGTFKVGGIRRDNAAMGSVRSETFTLSDDPTVDFLVMGGNKPESLYVALVDAANDQVLAKASGNNQFAFERKSLDVKAHAGKPCYILIVDRDDSEWGHLSVDDVNVTVQPY